MRFCTNWQIYADDVTVRSGRWLNGTYYSDAEYKDKVRTASRKEKASQPVLEDAFKALGFDPTVLWKEADGKMVKPKARPRTKGEEADDGLGAEAGAGPSPRAHGVLATMRGSGSRSDVKKKNVYTYCSRPSSMRIQVKCIYTFIFMHLIIPALCTFPYSVEIENGVFRLQLERETREVAGLHCEEANP